MRKMCALLLMLGIGFGAREVQTAEIRLTAPDEGTVVPMHYPVQKAFLNMPREPRIRYFASLDCRMRLREKGWYPPPIKLAWETSGLPDAQFSVLLSKTEDFAKPTVIPTKTNSVEVDNFFINQRYYWKVVASSGKLSVTSAVATFQTDDQAPRLLRIEKVENARDLGGRKAMRGKRVKQGMIYRTVAFNENARAVYFTPDELRDSPEHAEDYKKIQKRDEALLAKIADLEQRLKEPGAAQQLPYYWGKTWTVFRPQPEGFDSNLYANLASGLRAMPSHFMSVNPEGLTQDDRGCVRLPEVKYYAPAVFIQEFEAPEDGTMYVGCGADWFWDLRINGAQQVDRLAGNAVHPVATDNVFLEFPVRKGKNLAVVLVRSGTDGWRWCHAPLRQEQVLQRELDEVKAQRMALSRVVKTRTPGRLRLPQASVDYLLNELGIKTEIDLRGDDECYGMQGSPLGESVRYFQVPLGAYVGMGTEKGMERVAEVFKLFLDPANYPITVHCAGGQDRMGSLAFVLNGLLGVDEEELFLDWEATGFWNSHPGFTHARLFNLLLDVFRPLPGDTITEKIEHYVLECGFTHKDIETYRALMLE